MRKKLALTTIIITAVLSFTACASSGSTGMSKDEADREVLFQVSLLQDGICTSYQKTEKKGVMYSALVLIRRILHWIIPREWRPC